MKYKNYLELLESVLLLFSSSGTVFFLNSDI
ncbi:hypothetical protein ATE92_0492 [Ulvibacter sp. MAR_2010_11]|nr:hypothetical protein ATE92_0492 [Ulvibacter sp. MAR_2010_11]